VFLSRKVGHVLPFLIFSLALHQCNAYLGHLGRECQLCVQRRRHLWKQEHPGCGLAKEYDQRRPVCPNWSKPSIRGACAKSLAEPCALVICLPPMKTFRGSRAACCVQQAHLYSWIPIIERWLLKKRPILYHSHCGKGWWALSWKNNGQPQKWHSEPIVSMSTSQRTAQDSPDRNINFKMAQQPLVEAAWSCSLSQSSTSWRQIWNVDHVDQ